MGNGNGDGDGNGGAIKRVGSVGKGLLLLLPILLLLLLLPSRWPRPPSTVREIKTRRK